MPNGGIPPSCWACQYGELDRQLNQANCLLHHIRIHLAIGTLEPIFGAAVFL